MTISARFRPFGESAALVDLAGAEPETVWQAAHATRKALIRAGWDWITDVVATYDTVYVEFDIMRTDLNQVRDAVLTVLDDVLAQVPPSTVNRIFRLPVCYGGEFGPDLTSVARRVRLSVGDLIDRSVARTYRIRCLAGPVGAPMLDGPALDRPVPRQVKPRTSSAAGSVTLAGHQTFVRTMPGPSGWQIVGRTPLRLISLSDDPLVPWSPGDEIRFEAIEESSWHNLAGVTLVDFNG